MHMATRPAADCAAAQNMARVTYSAAPWPGAAATAPAPMGCATSMSLPMGAMTPMPMPAMATSSLQLPGSLTQPPRAVSPSPVFATRALPMYQPAMPMLGEQRLVRTASPHRGASASVLPQPSEPVVAASVAEAFQRIGGSIRDGPRALGATTIVARGGAASVPVAAPMLRPLGVATPAVSPPPRSRQPDDWVLKTTSSTPSLQSCASQASLLPKGFACPLTHQVMRDPVATVDGQVYERGAIERWFRQGRRNSPITGMELESTALAPQFALQAAIKAFLSHPCAPQAPPEINSYRSGPGSPGRPSVAVPGSPSQMSVQLSSAQQQFRQLAMAQAQAACGAPHAPPGEVGSHAAALAGLGQPVGNAREVAEVRRLLDGLQTELRRAEADLAKSASSYLPESAGESARHALSSTGGTEGPGHTRPTVGAAPPEGTLRAHPVAAGTVPSDFAAGYPMHQVHSHDWPGRSDITLGTAETGEAQSQQRMAQPHHPQQHQKPQLQPSGLQPPSRRGSPGRTRTSGHSSSPVPPPGKAVQPRTRSPGRAAGRSRTPSPEAGHPERERDQGPAPAVRRPGQSSPAAPAPAPGQGAGTARPAVARQTPRRNITPGAPSTAGAGTGSATAPPGPGSRTTGHSPGACARAAAAVSRAKPPPMAASSSKVELKTAPGARPPQRAPAAVKESRSTSPPSRGGRAQLQRQRSSPTGGRSAAAPSGPRASLQEGRGAGQLRQSSSAAAPSDPPGRHQATRFADDSMGRQTPMGSDQAVDGDALVADPRCLVDSSGRTALMHLAGEGDVEALKRHLATGADVNASDECHCTALMYAATYGHVGALRCLVEQGARVEAKSQDGWTPLITAAYNGHREAVHCLLDSRADVEAADERGWTSLMHVAFNGDNDTLRCLLEFRAQVDAIDADGRDALVYAAFNGHLDNAKCLLEQSGLRQREGQANDGARDTAVLFSAIRGHCSVLELLLQAYPATPETRSAAQKLAADHGHATVVDFLANAAAA